jgi:hypothetical protein
MTSWDFKRAFDSVPKSLLVHAWVRVGVPDKAAEYMVEIDEGAHTVVRSPAALARCGDSHDVGALNDMAFEAGCGTSQGDVQSPLSWVAVFDILLTALRKVGERRPEGRFYTQARDMSMDWVGESSFADDLFSYAGTREHLQDKADIVSAFAVICGMTLSVEKFRGVAIHWGNAKKQGITDGEEIIIHGVGWTESKVGLQNDGEIKYLGVTWDMHLSGAQEKGRMLDDIREAIQRLVTKNASTACKWLALRKSVYEKFLYRLRFLCWTLEEYEEIDKVIARGIRGMAKLPASFPTHLIYASREVGGMGYDRISSLAQSRKQSIVARYSQDKGASGRALQGLICRAFRAQGDVPEWLVSSVMKNWRTDMAVTWATSLCQWLHKAGSHLALAGDKPRCVETQIPAGLYPLRERWGVITIAEVKMEGDTPPILPNEMQEEYEDLSAIPASPIPARVGQVWSEPGEQGEVWEILGEREDQLDCMRWRRVIQGEVTHLVSGRGVEDYSRGCGGCTLVDRSRFAADGCRLIRNSPDKIGRDGVNRSEFLGEVFRTMEQFNFNASPEVNDTFAAWAGEADDVYLDGRLSPAVRVADWMRGQAHRTGILSWVRNKGGKWDYMIAKLGCTRADSDEELRLLAAAVLGANLKGEAEPRVWMQGTGLVRGIKRAKGRYDKAWITHGALRAHRWDQLRADTASTAKEEPEGAAKGGWLARRIALGGQTGKTCSGELTEREIGIIVRGHSWIGVEDLAGSLLLSCPLRRLAEKEMNTYLRERDDYRKARGAGPRWVGSGVGLAGAIWKQEGWQASTLRVKGGFEKFWSGRNRHLHDQQEGICELCEEEVETVDHIIWRCKEPTMTEAREQVMAEVEAASGKFPAMSKIPTQIAERWQEAAGRGRARQCWTGLLESEDISDLVQPATMADLADLRKLAKYCSLYSKGWGKMMWGRAAALGKIRDDFRKSQKRKINSSFQQTNLENYEHDRDDRSIDETHQEKIFMQEPSTKSRRGSSITKYFPIQRGDGTELSRDEDAEPSNSQMSKGVRKRKGSNDPNKAFSRDSKRRQEDTLGIWTQVSVEDTELGSTGERFQVARAPTPEARVEEGGLESASIGHRGRKRGRDTAGVAGEGMDMELSDGDRGESEEDGDQQEGPARKREGIGTRERA